jgi:hypothetical protein
MEEVVLGIELIWNRFEICCSWNRTEVVLEWDCIYLGVDFDTDLEDPGVEPDTLE